MKLIQPNCRIQFTAEDIDFIVAVLGPTTGNAPTLTGLLADPETRDLILDDDMLFRALLEQRGCLSVSHHFYFYVLVRHVLRGVGIEDRSVADYVAEVLTEFSRAENVRCVIPGKPHPLDYFFEMLAALQTADEPTCFYIRTHIGNQSLFFSGVFPEHIRQRAERRGFPNLSYYAALGKSNYRVARDHRLARKYDLSEVYDVLSDQFEPARKALNDLADRIFTFTDQQQSIERILQKTMGQG
ncbi:MAG: hypothetical protein H0X66_07740 [Verrucomicrobia bacterium]|nr:hypothetical protein [Verrucomicrobiota bacterium]